MSLCSQLPSLPGCPQAPPRAENAAAGADKDLTNDIHGKLLDVGHRYEAPSNLDFDTVTVSVWIQLTSDEANMKTIMANRFSGCQVDDRHAGYALFVNEWNTDNKQLVLMWCSENQGCASVASASHAISVNKWHHVGFTLTNTNEGVSATLYVDNSVAATKVDPTPRRKSTGKLFIGSHTDYEHPFRGRIANLAIWSIPRKPFDAFGDKPDANALEGHWPLNVPGDEAFADQTGHARNLTPAKRPRVGDLATPPPFDYLVPLPSEEELSSGIWPPETTPADVREKSDALGRQRREVVRNAMKHAYGNYEKHAFGYDEVLPDSGNRRNNWGGMATTMVDSLDTLWIMGLKDEFYRARDWIRDNLDFNRVQGSVSVFETTIRSLGGLLSAYDLSSDKVFLKKAQELGDKLFAAFGTSSGMPVNSISLQNPHVGSGGQVILAEVGTLQLEFRALARHTGVKKYAEASEKVHTLLRRRKPEDGLWGIHVDVASGLSAGGTVAFGALGDSFFEYLLKIWVQGDRTENEYWNDYEQAMDGLHKRVLQHSQPSNLAYLADYTPGGGYNHKMDHLACFVPGLLALGSYKRLKTDPARHQRDMEVAKALMYTCWLMYARQPTLIAPEMVTFQNGNDFTVPGFTNFYILRPETVESLFILNRITGAPVYRDWGFQIMRALDKHCKTTYGYGAYPDVRDVNRRPEDRMESFFLAETLKYLFLLQDPDSEISLDEFVFNTEAHPLRIFPKVLLVALAKALTFHTTAAGVEGRAQVKLHGLFAFFFKHRPPMCA